jgi:UDP-N-acetylmuramoylalanine--D-glutamate ligase
MSKQKVVILGGGESGTGSAILAKAKGYDVFLSDTGSIKENYKKELLENEIQFEEGTHTQEIILSANYVIKSPGIPDKNPLIQKIKENGI